MATLILPSDRRTSAITRRLSLHRQHVNATGQQRHNGWPTKAMSAIKALPSLPSASLCVPATV